MAKTLFDELDVNYEIYTIAPESPLQEKLRAIKRVTFVVRLQQFEPSISCKAIVITNGLVPVDELKNVRKAYPSIPIFYQLHKVTSHQQTKNIQTTCAAHNITPIDEHLTPVQIAEEVERILFNLDNQTKNRVISFFGTHSGAGVTTTVLNTADVLASKVNEKVLVLSLNLWDPADYFLPYEGKYISDLKIELKTNGLTEEKLLQAITKYDSFYHLAGNRDIKLQRFYKTEEIERLITLCKSLFDVVLIDGGTHFDNAAFAQAYKQSDLKFLVTTQEPKGYRGYWPHIFHQLIEPIGGKTDEFLLIVNQFLPEISLATEKNLTEELDISLLATIPNESIYGHMAIAQKKLLHTISINKEYKTALETIANSIISRANLSLKPVDESSQKNTGIFNKLFGKKKNSIYEESSSHEFIG